MDHRMKVVNEADFKELSLSDITVPVIVSKSESLRDYYDNTPNLQKELTDALNAYRVRPDKRSGQFHASLMQPTVHDAWKEKILMALPKGEIHDKLENEMACLNPLAKVEMWIRGPAAETYALEPAGVATFRYNVMGSRTVLAAPFAQIGNYIRESKGLKAMKQPVSMLATVQWLQSASPTMITQALNSGVQFYLGTVSEHESFYLPSGFVKAERSAISESTGFR
eukprot:1736734-Pyramimonas_sp.AAC.1